MIVEGIETKTSEKTSPSIILFTKYSTMTSLGSKANLYDERPTTALLDHGKARQNGQRLYVEKCNNSYTHTYRHTHIHTHALVYNNTFFGVT
jgi:hypothetical protein